jgi:hypothetical protein
MNPPVVPAADPYLRRRVAVLDTELAFVDTGSGDPVVFLHQQEITVRGSHFVQEDSPAEIGRALAAFVARTRT